jgi:hypothetical protein
MLMQSNLHAEFMSMCYEKGADLRSQFDTVRMQYETLLNVGIPVSDDGYRSLVVNFVPDNVSSFVAQISAGMKVWTLMDPSGSLSPSSTSGSSGSAIRWTLDAEALMQLAVEEWDRQESSKGNKKLADTDDSDTAVATVSSEDEKGERKRSKRQVVVCWNCGGKGHKRDVCTSPEQDSDSESSTDEPKWF